MDEASDYHEDHLRPQKKRRKYIAKACNECKRRKIKCNGQTPCQRCGRQRVDCIYADNPRTLGDTLYVRLAARKPCSWNGCELKKQ
ncbi:Zn(II)2Cys6 transcription factor domain-containing protein [Aspergillus chevalieri]|uniref:Zn(2)-C6 fungal-type domain-containing protein n=1 Tax=Aspergillus chevalieri TaxID=182096 RepID=A0A7R7VSJ3_ASPCH|nr:uncharacterized protein ACHE_51130S [Aspergillus chevalieri]BCR89932.1 hypothetical protein ACHE_51130S [Aspergillus chevalieri]